MAGNCLFCGRPADKIIGLRLRRQLEKGNAIWSPDTDAYLCDEHAASGYDVDITFTPRNDRTVHTVVKDGNGNQVAHNHTITKPVNTDDPQ